MAVLRDAACPRLPGGQAELQPVPVRILRTEATPVIIPYAQADAAMTRRDALLGVIHRQHAPESFSNPDQATLLAIIPDVRTAVPGIQADVRTNAVRGQGVFQVAEVATIGALPRDLVNQLAIRTVLQAAAVPAQVHVRGIKYGVRLHPAGWGGVRCRHAQPLQGAEVSREMPMPARAFLTADGIRKEEDIAN